MMFKDATNEPFNYECLLRNEESTNMINTIIGFFFPKHIPTYKHCWASYFQIAIKDKLLVTLILKQFFMLQYYCLCRGNKVLITLIFSHCQDNAF